MEPLVAVNQEQLDKKSLLERLHRAKAFTSEVKTAEDNARTLIVKISSISPDRSNDIVDPKGVDLTNYKKNPVVLLSHNYQSLPIAKCIDIEVQKDCILAKVLFPDAGIYDVADIVYEMAKAGFLNGWSIGFIPTEYTERKDDNGWGYTFTKWQLLEFSAVAVPDNQDALTIVRSKGINPEALEKLSDKEDAKQLEKARAAYETLEKVEVKEAEELEAKDEEAEEEEIVETKTLNDIIVDTKTKTLILLSSDGGKTELKTTEELFERIKSFNPEAKSGRVISKKNENLIDNAIKSLTELKAAIKNEDEVEDEVTDENKASGKAEVIEKSEEKPSEFLVKMASHFKKADKEVGLGLKFYKLSQSRQQDAKSDGERSE